MVWTRHNDDYFKDTRLRIKPTRPQLEFADRDLFHEMVAPARQRNMTPPSRPSKVQPMSDGTSTSSQRAGTSSTAPK
ncbi:hypothetical protein ACQ86N_22290 [Puia sp. P3]|uniref:hypothetical protein n=1 Tax=Puia sp. P3 TaxID=3423952 RepID=UPI003D666E30